MLAVLALSIAGCTVSSAPVQSLAGLQLSLSPASPAAFHAVDSLGLAVENELVSTCLVGPEPTLFEAARVVFGRVSRADDSSVVMTCTFSTSPRLEEAPLPTRSITDFSSRSVAKAPRSGTVIGGLPSKKNMMRQIAARLSKLPVKLARGLEAAGPERVAAAAAAVEIKAAEVATDGSAAAWVDDAYTLPSRVACQFAVYPLGTSDYMESVSAIVDAARSSPCFQAGQHTQLCTTLEGEGAEIFDVLQQSFALGREHAAHLVMTATVTTAGYAQEAGSRR